MPKSLIVFVLLGLLLSGSNTEAQKPLEARPSIPTSGYPTATAHDGSDQIVGGYRTVERGFCRAAQEAFLIDAGAGAGNEVDLFAGLQSFDLRHLLASAVSAVDIDPATGERIVAVDVLLGWEAAKEGGEVAAAQGVLVLRFSANGLLLRDAYFGSRPSGPPPTAPCLGRSQLPSSTGLAATFVKVDPHGEILLRGRSLPSGSAREGLSIRMSSDLEVLASSAEPPELLECPSPISPNTLISVKELAGTYLVGDASDLFSDDNCVLNIMPIGHEFGIESGFQADLPPEALTIHVDLNFFDGTTALVKFELKSNSGAWVTVARREPDRLGKIVDSIVVDDPNGYIHNATRVFLRLLILPTSGGPQGGDGLSAAPDAREDIDIDMLQMETEP